MKRKLIFVITSLALCLSLAACGSAGYKSESAVSVNSLQDSEAYWGDGYYDNAIYEEYMAETSEESIADKGEAYEDVAKETGRKLIKNYGIEIETEDMDELIPLIEAEVSHLGGYVENLDTYNGSNYNRSYRHTNYTVRIPAGLADQFVEFAGNHGNITNKTLNVNDVTMSYVDTQAQRDSLRIQQERLLELLSKAETVEDILTIEERLTDVRYRLESLESTLRTYDNLVDYSTIRVEISEVVEYTAPEPITYGQRISESFTRGIKSFVTGLQNFSIWFVGALPLLLLWAVIITGAVFFIKFLVKKNKNKLEKERKKALENIPAKTDGNNTPPMNKE